MTDQNSATADTDSSGGPPIGFQTERRDLWEAPNVYLNMSPFLPTT